MPVTLTARDKENRPRVHMIYGVVCKNVERVFCNRKKKKKNLSVTGK